MNTPSSTSNRFSPTIQTNWLLSFGDLLTLLLCFFLSVLSLSPLNPAYKSPEKGKSKQIVNEPPSTEATGAAGKTSGGIELANSSGTVADPSVGSSANNFKQLSVWLTEADFREGNLELLPEAQERLKSQVFGSAYERVSVRIEGCAEVEQGRAEAAWAASLSRILTLRSQMIDAGIPATTLSYRVLGPDCETLRGKEGTEQAVVRIRIEQKLNHG